MPLLHHVQAGHDQLKATYKTKKVDWHTDTRSLTIRQSLTRQACKIIDKDHEVILRN